MRGAPEIRLTAIVLRRVDYGESDRIVTFYTRERGKVAAFARAARKSQKRFGGALEPFHRLTLAARDRRGDLLSLASADIARGRAAISAELDLISRGSYLTELLAEATREHEAHAELFDLVDAGLDVLAGAPFAQLDRTRRDGWLLAFELKLLALAGYRPYLTSCAECGEEAGEADRYRFVAERGALYCGSHAHGQGVAVALDLARQLDASIAADVAVLGEYDFSAAEVAEARNVIGPFLRHQLGKELRSARFLDGIP